MDLPWLTAEGANAKDLYVLNKFQQVPKSTSSSSMTASADAVYSKIPSPVALYEDITKRINGQNSHVAQSHIQAPQTQATNANRSVQMSTNTQHPIGSRSRTTTTPPSRILNNVLVILDGTVSLLKPEQQADLVRKFRIDMAKNLDNERNLYKVMGFHRKKTMTVEGMKSKIMSDDLDSIIDDAVWTYIARLLQRDVHVIDLVAKSRTHFPVAQQSTGHMPILYLTASHEYVELEGDTNTAIHRAIKPKLPTAPDVVDMSLPDIRAWFKLLDLKVEAKTKVAMSAALAAAFANATMDCVQ